MLALRIVFLLVLLCVCSVGPGLYFLRRLRWSPLEKFCGSIGLSLVFIYLTVHVANLLNLGRWAHYAVSLVCLASVVAARRDLLGMFRAPAVQRVLKWFVFLWVWALAMLMLIRHYSGGGWGGDWLEHYQRVLFFLGDWPEVKLFTDVYTLPARPPMTNAVAAHFLGQLGPPQFALFQVIFAFLNLLACLPCFLLLDVLARRGRRRLFVLGALLAISPMFMENVTYSWTKLFAAFYIILSLWFYLAALRKGDSVRLIAAAVAMAAGILAHYSAGPFALFLVLHYLLRAWRKRPERWREMGWAGGLAAALLATWFAWSVAAYGLKDTLSSNTTVKGVVGQTAEGYVEMFYGNIVDTIVPHTFRAGTRFENIVRGASPLARLREHMFLIYQTNLVFALGLLAGPLAIGLLVAAFVRGGKKAAPVRPARKAVPPPGRSPPGRGFWAAFIVFCSLAGIATHGVPDAFGVAHVVHQPLILLGLTFLAGALYRLPAWLRWAAVLGLRVDFFIGVLLQHYFEHALFTTSVEQGRLVATTIDTPALGSAAAASWYAKKVTGLAFLGDGVGDTWVVVLVAVIVVAFEILMGLLICRLFCQPRAVPAGPPATNLRRK